MVTTFETTRRTVKDDLRHTIPLLGLFGRPLTFSAMLVVSFPKVAPEIQSRVFYSKPDSFCLYKSHKTLSRLGIIPVFVVDAFLFCVFSSADLLHGGERYRKQK
jgi:hypothetical protein